MQAKIRDTPSPSSQEINQLGSLYSSENLQEALIFAQKLAVLYPREARLFLSLGAIQDAMNLPSDAISSYERALELKPNYAEAHNNLGNAFKKLREFEKAIPCFERSLELLPNDPEVLCNLGNAFFDMGELERAVIRYERAIKIQPKYPEAHVRLGDAYWRLDEFAKAADSFLRAREQNPSSPEIHYRLCNFYEKNNRNDDLWTALTEAKKWCSADDPFIAISSAHLMLNDGDLDGAIELAESTSSELDDAELHAARSFLLGTLYDRLGEVEQAFHYFQEGNDLVKASPAAEQISGAAGLLKLKLLKERFSPDWVSSWKPVDCEMERNDPVFLVGFPRSGTTLLDTMLRSHRDISVVEEQPCVREVYKALGQLPGGYPDGLAELDPANFRALRQVYFAELDRFLTPDDNNKTIIDKLPLNIIHSGLIQRIFPNARFTFAQRHPCDCVLSCFMQNFRINEATANFLNLEEAAEYYDRVMDQWQNYQEILPLKVHTIVYEDLIESLEGTIKPLFDFLGVDWDECVKKYATTAQNRGTIRTPSYNQVTQPLYKRASGRWEKYAEQMKPALPTLAPWAMRMGYRD